MAKVDSVRTGSQSIPIPTQMPREKKEEVATGVGAAAGISGAAYRTAGKRALQAEIKAQNLERGFNQVVETVTTTSRNISRNTEAVSGLWGSFKTNITKYTKQLRGYANRFKDTKVIGAIVKSPVTKAATKVFGGALAFFVLITGVSKAVRTGAIAFEDIKSQYNETFGQN